MIDLPIGLTTERTTPMPEYTAAQIDAAARALHEYSHHSGWDSTDAEAVAETRGAVRAALAALDTPPPGLATWTPQDGPLDAAIANLPDGHPVTIRDQRDQLLHGIKTTVPKLGMAPYVRAQFGTETWWLDESNSITSASWLLPAPAWDGALVVVDSTHELLWCGPDGLYRGDAVGASRAFTATELEQQYGPIRVLIDADGNHTDTIPKD